jgi:hypothetical protein
MELSSILTTLADSGGLASRILHFLASVKLNVMHRLYYVQGRVPSTHLRTPGGTRCILCGEDKNRVPLTIIHPDFPVGQTETIVLAKPSHFRNRFKKCV